MLTPTESRMAIEYERAEMLQRRMDVADEMLAKLIDDIGTGPGVAALRAQALAIKHELRGVRQAAFPEDASKEFEMNGQDRW